MNWKSMLGLSDEEAPAVIEEAATPVEREAPKPEPPPGLEWWWEVQHLGHPAFYLRTLMPGDFAPGRLPAPRHVRPLERPAEGLPAEVTCGTCGDVPRSEDLEPIERSTGQRGFLGEFRSGRARWPAPTKITSCWMCSGQAPAHTRASVRGSDVLVCAGCAKHLGKATA